MRVSVIIPFNKGDSYLRDCFNSLSEQEYTDYEVLLIADHYEGNINELIAPYMDKINIRLFELKGDDKTGVAAARNVGLDNAEGEFVYFLDADDYIFQDAIRTLVETADEKDEDMVYGKKHYTYYRRDVFLPVYIEKREALIAQRYAESGAGEAEAETSEGESDEEEEEEEDSQEPASEDEESQESAENDEEAEITEETEPVELTEEEQARLQAKLERKLRRAMKRRRIALKKAVKRLIYKKKRFRNISVLHILFRRNIIEERNLRFNENLKYYSDIPFMTTLLDNEELHIRKKFFSHYIKRKHQDIVNLPALTQIQDERRFDEMIDTFKQVFENLNPEGRVRRAIEHQLVLYTSGYFLKKVKRSESNKWRKERFKKVGSLLNEVRNDTLKKEDRWVRRSVKAVRDGNLDKSVKIITRHLGWRKFVRMLKGKKVLAKHMYVRYLKNKPVSQNTIMFESFFGKNYSDSPKYMYEYIAKNYPGKYNFVWVMNKKFKLPYGGKIVKRFSIKYMYYLATSRYFVFNVRQPEWFKRRKGMTFFQTWHGTPLKRLAFDIEDVFGASKTYKKQIYKQSRGWDYLLSPNPFTTKCFRSCFQFEGNIVEYGYPRNDILHRPEGAETAIRIKESLGLPKDKKLILYAPTWRDDECYGHGMYKFELQLDLNLMRERLGDEYIVLLRTHYFIADAIDTTEFEGFAVNVCRYDDIAELYLISDILITDYSSVFFDYAGLRRPMLFYTYDLEKYRDILHGFYMDMEEEVPGPMLFTTEEVINAIENIDDINIKFADKYDAFYEKYCGLEDGNATEKCVKKLLTSE